MFENGFNTKIIQYRLFATIRTRIHIHTEMFGGAPYQVHRTATTTTK